MIAFKEGLAYIPPFLLTWTSHVPGGSFVCVWVLCAEMLKACAKNVFR